MSDPIGSMINGIIIGLVKDLADPEGLARVKVTFPYLDGQESAWARLATLMAGNGRGSLFRPEVDDEVLVGFERGDPKLPFILGALWNGQDKPPPMGSPDKDNNWRAFHSRSGHIFRFDDTKDKESIELIDKDDQRRLKIDCAEKKIQLLSEGSGDTIEVKAPSGTLIVETKDKISVTCTSGDIVVDAPAGALKVTSRIIDITASESVSMTAGTSMSLKAGASMSLSAPKIDLN